MIDVSDNTVVIGSDPQEWYLGSEAVKLLTVSTTHSRTYHYDIRQLEAFEMGTIGSAAADTMVEFEPSHVSDVQLKSDPLPLRLTAIFILEQGSWLITFWHAAVPTPDDQRLLTPSFRRQ